MEDKEFYIFGIPVKTDLCEIRFLKYHEYIQNLSELSMMSLNVLHIFYQYKKMNVTKDKEFDEQLEELKKESLYNIVLSQPSFLQAYFKVFSLVIDNDDAIEQIFDSEELFMRYRQLVMDMNMLSESEVSPNPKIQSYIDKSQMVKQRDSEKQTFSDIVSSVVVGSSIPFDKVLEMTVLQLYSVYYRIGAMKAYDSNTLFATVSDKVKIESWGKNIDLFTKQKSGMSVKEFNSTIGAIFK